MKISRPLPVCAALAALFLPLSLRADAGGRANWVSQLNAGADRHNVMAGFYNSAEFNAIMASYGIY